MQFALVGAEVPRPCCRGQLELAAWLFGHNADRAAFGITPKERALWPLQDLDIFDVVEGGTQALRAAHIDTVDIDADALVACRLVTVRQDANAADIHDQRARTREEWSHLQGRNSTVSKIDE